MLTGKTRRAVATKLVPGAVILIRIWSFADVDRKRHKKEYYRPLFVHRLFGLMRDVLVASTVVPFK